MLNTLAAILALALPAISQDLGAFAYLASAPGIVTAEVADQNGNLYITGDVSGPFPTTPGAFQRPISACVYEGGCSHVFVEKHQVEVTVLGGNPARPTIAVK